MSFQGKEQVNEISVREISITDYFMDTADDQHSRNQDVTETHDFMLNIPMSKQSYQGSVQSLVAGSEARKTIYNGGRKSAANVKSDLFNRLGLHDALNSQV